jgi:CheY-like chemotaxis protein
MRVLNGFEVLEWLRNQTFSAQIRVIVLSGSELEEDKDRAARLGAADYLVKPVRTSDLDRLLQDVFPGKPKPGVRSQIVAQSGGGNMRIQRGETK